MKVVCIKTTINFNINSSIIVIIRATFIKGIGIFKEIIIREIGINNSPFHPQANITRMNYQDTGRNLEV